MSDKIQIKDNLSLTVGKIADIKFLIEIITLILQMTVKPLYGNTSKPKLYLIF